MSIDQLTCKPVITPSQALARVKQYMAKGEWDHAEAWCRKVLAYDANDHAALHSLGVIASETGRLPLAAKSMAKAISLKSDIAVYHRNIGEVFRRMGKIEGAIVAAKKAIALDGRDADSFYNLGLALIDAGKQSEAIDAYQQSVAINPKHNFAWNNLGNCYSQSGDIEEAKKCFHAAIKNNHRFIDAHFNLAALKKFTEGDRQLALLRSLKGEGGAMPVYEKIRLNFTLGKAEEDCGNYDEAFEAYLSGNRAYSALHPFHEAKAIRSANKIREVFTREFVSERLGVGSQNPLPIFIIGMPRSGTTLVEQILASHPDVVGAGEIDNLGRVLRGSAGKKALIDVAAYSREKFRELGDSYCESLKEFSPDAKRIINKMPGNYLHVGLIKLLLPQAKVIHVMRDPMDGCFSCYAKLFASETMDFTYDLEMLGRHYVRYRNLMTHWEQVLPEASVLHVRYEDLVGDVEGHARRLLSYSELPWDDACLSFHKTEREVKTASLAQVRSPIYHSSLARWQRFESHLQPLLSIVQSYRP